jgi:hypothetical protein
MEPVDMIEMRSLEEQIRTAKRVDDTTSRKFLRGVRENVIRRSDLVAKVGKELVARGGFATEDESAS